METQHIASVKRNLTYIEERFQDYLNDYKPPYAKAIRESFFRLEQLGWTQIRNNGQSALAEGLEPLQLLTEARQDDLDLLHAAYQEARRNVHNYLYSTIRGSFFPDNVFDRLLQGCW